MKVQTSGLNDFSRNDQQWKLVILYIRNQPLDMTVDYIQCAVNTITEVTCMSKTGGKIMAGI